MFASTKRSIQSCATEEMTRLAICRLRSRLWMTRQWVLALASTSGASSTRLLDSCPADSGEAEGGGEVRLLPRRRALHEVYVLLIGECLGATARTPSFSEAHIPVCVAC